MGTKRKHEVARQKQLNRDRVNRRSNELYTIREKELAEAIKIEAKEKSLAKEKARKQAEAAKKAEAKKKADAAAKAKAKAAKKED